MPEKKPSTYSPVPESPASDAADEWKSIWGFRYGLPAGKAGVSDYKPKKAPRLTRGVLTRREFLNLITGQAPEETIQSPPGETILGAAASVSRGTARRNVLKFVGSGVLTVALYGCSVEKLVNIDPPLREQTRVVIEGATEVIADPTVTPSPTVRTIVESIPQKTSVAVTDTPTVRVTLTPEKVSSDSPKRKEIAEWLATADALETIQGQLCVMPCQLDNKEYDSLSPDLKEHLNAVKWNSCVSACMTALCRLKEFILSRSITGPQIGDVVNQLISQKLTWNGFEYSIIFPNYQVCNIGIVTAVQILTGDFFEDRLINQSLYTVRSDNDTRPPSISRTDYSGTLQKMADVTDAGGLVMLIGKENQQISGALSSHVVIASGVDLKSGFLTIHDPLRNPPGPIKNTIEQFFDNENGETQFYGALGFVPKNI